MMNRRPRWFEKLESGDLLVTKHGIMLDTGLIKDVYMDRGSACVFIDLAEQRGAFNLNVIFPQASLKTFVCVPADFEPCQIDGV